METILVVDDNRQISNFLAGSILPSMGYETLVAYDGKSALEMVRKHSQYLDLMLLDLQLPDMTGLDILRKLAEENHSVPTILITGHSSEEVAVDALRLGVQDYLTKPVDIDVLAATITRALTISRLRHEAGRLNAQLKEQVTWLTVLTRVGKSITSTLDVDDVLKRIVEAGVVLTRADEGFLALLDQPNGQLYLRAVKNIDEDRIKTLRLPVTDSVTGLVIRGGHPVRTSQGEGKPLKVSTGYLVYSLLHVPILSKGIPLGVLAVDNRATLRAFTETDEAMLTSLADYAAAALENANLYEKVRQELQERQRTAAALHESEERYALAVNGANDGLWDWNLKTQQIYFSPRWKAMLGFAEKEIDADPEEWFSRIHPDDRERTRQEIMTHLQGSSSHIEIEYRMQHKDGSYLWMLSRGLAVRGPGSEFARMAGSQTDITIRKQTEEKLLYDALHDGVTHLYNRTALLDRLKLSIERYRRNPSRLFAVLYMDLDRFKDVNDSLGHYMGDQMLIATARMLESILRPTDMVSRLGGDEYVILIDDIGAIEDATRIADRILEELRTTPLLEGHQLFVTASIGIVLNTPGYHNPDDVLRDADIAMYRAKSLGKARYEIFDTDMRERIIQRLGVEKELRLALERNEFRVFYQPILSLVDRQILGFEALVRWQHPTRGLTMPKDFIAIAEDTGLIIPIDRWVLRAACQQLRLWDRILPGVPPLKISVNISGKQISQPDLIPEIQRVLADTGMNPERLNLEITESVVMENYTYTAEVMAKLQKFGIQIQVDDFGIGYSSLSYLSRFPMNALKIDRSFISTMGQDQTNARIVQAIVMMTHGLGIKVIAEGVETRNQLEQLKALGCEFVQGYLIAKPMNEVDTVKLIEKFFGVKQGRGV